MKKHIAKILILTLLVAAIAAVPALSRAQDAATPAPAKEKASSAKRSGLVPFHGKLTAVDTNAMTLTVGKRMLQITSKTKITKNGEPAILEDGVIGEPVSGAYKKTEEGKLNAVSVHFGAKAASKKTKKSKSN